MSFRFNQGDRPLPGYTIQRGVGSGGFGEVYYATSDGGKDVALKFLRDNPQVELRGAQHCLNLKSPHLVGIHDIKQNAGGDYFVVMEYVHGPSLRDLMNEDPRGLGPQKAAYFLREIGKGLAYLHDRGIVHRDLKPGNIFYEDGFVKIGDYGLSKLIAASQHSGQTVSVGTVHYMAPEVGSGNYDKTIDLYALGVIFYEMLLGRVPFSGSSMGEVLMKHLTAQPEVDELPAPFPQVIRKALAKDPRDRYQSVEELMADVFAVGDLERSVAMVDSLALTRMAATVAQKVKVHAGGGSAGHAGTGSSNVPPIGATPPPRIEPSRNRQTPLREQLQPIWSEFKERPFFVSDANDFPQRDRLSTGLMGLFLGMFGVHRFHTGYTRLGIIQVLATCFTAIGALWGIIEGIYILSGGDYRDSLGRPLLPNKSANPTARSNLARVFWALLGIFFGLTSIGLCIGATFAPAEYSHWDLENGERLYFNELHWMYVGAAFAAALCGFTLWKAAHRGGLPFWRVTIRPALMAFCGATAASALVAEAILVPYSLQLPLLLLAGVMGVAFLVLWLLRGDGMVLQPGDGYWNRALMGVFIVLMVFSAGGAGLALQQWERRDFSLTLNREPWRNVRVMNGRVYGYVYADARSGAEIREIRVPQSVYDRRLVVLGLCSVMFVGSLVESHYRRMLAARCRTVLADQA